MGWWGLRACFSRALIFKPPPPPLPPPSVINSHCSFSSHTNTHPVVTPAAPCTLPPTFPAGLYGGTMCAPGRPLADGQSCSVSCGSGYTAKAGRPSVGSYTCNNGVVSGPGTIVCIPIPKGVCSPYYVVLKLRHEHLADFSMPPFPMRFSSAMLVSNLIPQTASFRTFDPASHSTRAR